MEDTNHKIKTLVRQTYGLRNERYFILKLFSLTANRRGTGGVLYLSNR